jgi:peptidoglycan/LPS O-acetylase OafA/YrhL
MIQRPQTVYLLLVSLLSVLLLTGPVALFSSEGTDYILTHSWLISPDGQKMEMATWPMTVLFVAVAFLSFINIFFYRNRVRQMRVAIFLIFLFLGVIAMILYYVNIARSHLNDPSVLYQWRIVIPPIAAILTYLAFRRIRRDELLVKAYERIR